MGRGRSTVTTADAPDEALLLSERLWTITEVSTYLGVPVGTLYQWRSRRQGPRGLRVGNHVRYRPSEIAKWLREDCDDGAQY